MIRYADIIDTHKEASSYSISTLVVLLKKQIAVHLSYKDYGSGTKNRSWLGQGKVAMLDICL